MCFHLVTEREYLDCEHRLPMQRHYVGHTPHWHVWFAVADDADVGRLYEDKMRLELPPRQGVTQLCRGMRPAVSEVTAGWSITRIH